MKPLNPRVQITWKTKCESVVYLLSVYLSAYTQLNWRDIMGKNVLHLEKYLTEVLLECPKLELNMATWDDHMSSDSIGEGADQNDCP